MIRARSFFFVCLGILALALAYHFGATTATAQAPGLYDASCIWSGGAAVVIGRTLYQIDSAGTVERLDGIPGTSRVVACIAAGVLLENGQVWRYNTGWGGWGYLGTLPASGATPAQSMSIGQLKARYAK